MPMFAVGLLQMKAELGAALTAQLMGGNSFEHPNPSSQAEPWVTEDELPSRYKIRAAPPKLGYGCFASLGGLALGKLLPCCWF